MSRSFRTRISSSCHRSARTSPQAETRGQGSRHRLRDTEQLPGMVFTTPLASLSLSTHRQEVVDFKDVQVNPDPNPNPYWNSSLLVASSFKGLHQGLQDRTASIRRRLTLIFWAQAFSKSRLPCHLAASFFSSQAAEGWQDSASNTNHCPKRRWKQWRGGSSQPEGINRVSNTKGLKTGGSMGFK